MKERKIMVTIEALTNIPIKEFSKKSIQEMFDGHFIGTGAPYEETFIAHQVRGQVVKENK